MSDRLTWREVKSTAVKKIAYKDGTLYVQFQSGRQYRYPKCPIQKYNALLGANRGKHGSVGRTFNIQVGAVLTGIEMPPGDVAVSD